MKKVRLIQGKGDWEATPPTGASDADLYQLANDLVVQGGVVSKSAGDSLVHELDTPGLGVTIDPGTIYVPNSDWSPNSILPRYYQVVADNPEDLALASNSSGLDRVDLICVMIDKVTTPNDDASNVCPYVVVAGTPGGGAPAVPDDHELLATVLVVDGATSIVNADIEDNRRNIALKVGLVGDDGWTTIDETLVYNSATSVEVSGVDVTTQFRPGTKVRFTNNSTTYYGTVKNSSFSTDTIVNFLANNDFSIANLAITSVAISHEEAPSGFPAEFSFTPTSGGQSGTVGAYAQDNVNGRFHVVGRQLYFTAELHITNKGSWADAYVLKGLPIDSSRLTTVGVLIGHITPNAGNPAQNSRGVPYYNPAVEDSGVLFSKAIGSNSVEWSDVAVSDWVEVSGWLPF